MGTRCSSQLEFMISWIPVIAVSGQKNILTNALFSDGWQISVSTSVNMLRMMSWGETLATFTSFFFSVSNVNKSIYMKTCWSFEKVYFPI